MTPPRLLRPERALKLRQRALEAADATLLPHTHSLIHAALLSGIAAGHVFSTEALAHLGTQRYAELQLAAWRNSAAALAAARRGLALSHARWAAGTLFEPTREERAYFKDEEMPVALWGAFTYIATAQDAAFWWPTPLRETAAEAARVAAVAGALRAALDLDRRGLLERDPRTGRPWPPATRTLLPIQQSLQHLLAVSLSEQVDARSNAAAGGAPLLHALRSPAGGLSRAEEAALRALLQRATHATAAGQQAWAASQGIDLSQLGRAAREDPAGARGRLTQTMAAAAARTVAPLLQLHHAADEADHLGRAERAIELRERVLAAAEACLPRDSLVLSVLLCELAALRISAAQGVRAAATGTVAGGTPQLMPLMQHAWRTDARALACAKQSARLLEGRWRAGTLYTPMPEEVAYFDGRRGGFAAHMAAAEPFFRVACEAFTLWPPPDTDAQWQARLRCAGSALRAALALHDAGWVERDPRSGAPPEASYTMWCGLRSALQALLTIALSGGDDQLGLLQGLREHCGLTAHEEAALRSLAALPCVATEAWRSMRTQFWADAAGREADDGAAHGLRACALPDCGQAEPHPKTFKLCGRCRAAAYCCAAHQAADFKRHKRADGCCKPPAAAP
jgi:hypothetical protein